MSARSFVRLTRLVPMPPAAVIKRIREAGKYMPQRLGLTPRVLDQIPSTTALTNHGESAMTSSAWTVAYRPGAISVDLDDADGSAIAEVYVWSTEGELPALKLAYLFRAAPALREALSYAMRALEDTSASLFCECDDCEQCGLSVDECTSIPCSDTCQCSLCRSCVAERALEEARAALAACEPPAKSEAAP